ncbi:MAG: hypothetical protein RL199_335 [Pseudomonadota bacterium]|jgi:hypothetical protein
MRLRIVTSPAHASTILAGSQRLAVEFERRGHDAAVLPVDEVHGLAAGDVAVTWNGLGAMLVPPGVTVASLLQSHPMYVRGLLGGQDGLPYNDVVFAPATASWVDFLAAHGPASLTAVHLPLAPPRAGAAGEGAAPSGGVVVFGDVEDPAEIWRRLAVHPPRVLAVARAFRDAALSSPREALHDVYRTVLDAHGIDVPRGRWKEPDHATFGRLAEVVESWVSASRFNALVRELDAAGVPLTLVGRGFDTLGLRCDHRRIEPADTSAALQSAASAGLAVVRTSSPDLLDLTSLTLLSSGVALLVPPSSLRRTFDVRGGLVFLDDADAVRERVLPLLKDPSALARRRVLARAAVERHFTWSAAAGALVQAVESVRTGRGTT